MILKNKNDNKKEIKLEEENINEIVNISNNNDK